MRNLNFRLAKANGILCFGEEGVEINFKDYGNVVLVHGINLDNPGTEDDPASNGAGKSSLQEILSIGLYGKTVKNTTKLRGADIINTLSDKGRVEVIWDDYRVVRTFRRSKSGSVSSKIEIWESHDQIWDNDSKHDLGGAGNSQNWINDKLGLSHHAFCNVVIFDDSSTYSFLEADAESKRQIVENLLGLDAYRQYHKNAKAYLKLQKQLVDRLSMEYRHSQDECDSCVQHIESSKSAEKVWKEKKKSELQSLLGRIKAKTELLASSDIGREIANWQSAQDRIKDLTKDITAKEAKREGAEKLINEARERIVNYVGGRDELMGIVQQLNSACNDLRLDLKKSEHLWHKLDSLEDGAVCPTCHSVISKDNYGHVVEETEVEMAKLKEDLKKKTSELTEKQEDLKKANDSMKKVQDYLAKAEEMSRSFEREIMGMRNEISDCAQVPKPEGNTVEQILEAEIAELKQQARQRKEEFEGDSPYKQIIAESEAKKQDKETYRDKKSEELKVAEKELPYYQYWVEAFGDNGIRKFVVDGIIPALNNRIAYWMQYLIDSKIELTFDNTLEDTITRNGNSVKYHGMSKGETQRGNLAVSQAFAYVMMLNSGSCPSLVFLDEVTGGGIDRAGVVGIYNMIFELAKERQVFVTTHNENLLKMLQGCEKITLKKENDITVLVS